MARLQHGSIQSSKQQTQQSKRGERASKTASDRHFQTRLVNRVVFQALITSDTQLPTEDCDYLEITLTSR